MKYKNMFADMLFTGIYLNADLFKFFSVYSGVSVDSVGLRGCPTGLTASLRQQ